MNANPQDDAGDARPAGKRKVLAWVVIALVAVGILYRFLLPIAPYWVDISFLVAMAVLFILVALNRRHATKGR